MKPFGWRDKVGYALGDFGCNMSFAFINNYMMVFFVSCMGINPVIYGVIIFLAKCWDAVNDPIIGGLCDRTKPGKNGKFKPWIQWGSLVLLVMSILLFIFVPSAPDAVKIALCFGVYCVWSVAYTSVNVPYGSMQSVITTDSVQRAELSTWRSIGAMLAQAPVMVLLPLIVYDDNDVPIGGRFIVIAAVMGAVGVVAFQLMCRMVTERVPYVGDGDREKFNYFKTLGSFFKNRPIVALSLSTLAYMTFIMTSMSSMQYLFMHYFKNTSLLSIGTVIMGVPMVFAILLIKPLVKRFSKKGISAYPFVLGIAATAVLTFAKITNPWIWLIFFGISMCATGFFNVLIWAMVADCIDYQEYKTGRREEASIYATYSFFRKVAQGLGSALISFALAMTGFDENLVEQAPGVGENIRFMCGLLPLIGNVLCFAVLVLMYNLGKAELGKVAQALSERRSSHDDVQSESEEGDA